MLCQHSWHYQKCLTQHDIIYYGKFSENHLTVVGIIFVRLSELQETFGGFVYITYPLKLLVKSFKTR